MAPRRVALACGLWAGLAACGGDGQRRRQERMEGDARYADAERAFSRRENEEAERLFLVVGAAAEAAGEPEGQALVLYRRGQLRERARDAEAALALYVEAEEFRGTEGNERAAFAAWRQAKVMIEMQGRLPEGRAALRRVIDTYPNASAADKVAKYMAIRRKPAEKDDRRVDVDTVRFMLDAAERHQAATVGDNLLFFAAWAQIHRLGDLGGARTTLRRLAGRYFVSPLLDDALWLLAAIDHRQGRTDEALAACEALLQLRVDQDYLIGGYRGRRLDDAAIAVGLLRLHHQRDAAAAATAFQRLLDEFPTTVFRDDAWFGLAQAQALSGRTEASHETLRRLLDDRPDSRHAALAQAVLDGTQVLPGPNPAGARATLLHLQGKGEL